MIPDPSELDPNAKNLLILDDCFLGRQNKADAYYTRGWHNNCDTIFLSQNYFRLPRQTIRENWWSNLSPSQQAAYIKKHPKSTKAQQAKKDIISGKIQVIDVSAQ